MKINKPYRNRKKIYIYITVNQIYVLWEYIVQRAKFMYDKINIIEIIIRQILMKKKTEIWIVIITYYFDLLYRSFRAW